MKSAHRKIHVDVFGNASGASGWATHSVGYAQALNKVTPVSFRAGRRVALRGLFGPLRMPLLRGLRKDPGQFGVVISGTPSYAEPSSRWIVWETTELPEAQQQLCSSTQFLWTPSSWGRQNLISNGIDPARVAVVPEGVDADFFRPGSQREGRFRFLMVGKWERRKHTEGLLRAFTEEFGQHENVELYLHAHNAYIPGFSLKKRVEDAGFSNNGNIVLGAPCAMPALRQLYQSANCFVLPTRAEGWGLPILESMACGVPAIVTNYSAPTDFVSEENGYLVNVARMVEAHDEDFNIHTGLWAEPDIGHLRHQMRTAFENRAALAEKGRLARLTAERFTWGNAATISLETIRQHLSTLGK